VTGGVAKAAAARPIWRQLFDGILHASQQALRNRQDDGIVKDGAVHDNREATVNALIAFLKTL
jgi:hypothetical protein